MKIRVFRNQEIVLELMDDDTVENARVRQEIDLLVHTVKSLSESTYR